MTYEKAFESYMITGKLPEGFLGLDGAPRNNLKWYRQRSMFARWVAKHFAVTGKGPEPRSQFERSHICRRLGVAARLRGADEPMLKTLVAILILESGIKNAGFGKDRFGTSLAIGPMQTKWAAVMDGGIPYEGYLDIVTDRNPLIGVDAGVGYFLRFARRHETLDAVCKYNDPRTSAATNEHYIEAFDRAKRSVLFEGALYETTRAFKEKRWLTFSDSLQGEATL